MSVSQNGNELGVEGIVLGRISSMKGPTQYKERRDHTLFEAWQIMMEAFADLDRMTLDGYNRNIYGDMLEEAKWSCVDGCWYTRPPLDIDRDIFHNFFSAAFGALLALEEVQCSDPSVAAQLAVTNGMAKSCIKITNSTIMDLEMAMEVCHHPRNLARSVRGGGFASVLGSDWLQRMIDRLEELQKDKSFHVRSR
jgi:hypothetical protein